jgi:outer membrane protein
MDRTAGHSRGRLAMIGVLLSLACMVPEPLEAQAGREIDLTLEAAVRMTIDDSYRVRRLRLDVDRTRSLLQAQRAGLKSRVFLNFATPEFERISENKWNSTIGRNEIVREHSQRWQMDFSIEQPVILLGYPTNGYLSLNNRVYRYTQFSDEEDDIRYYNRYFVQYRQPFFQPNYLKNNLEEAELDLESSELAFQSDAVNIIDDVADEFYDLFRVGYQRLIFAELVENLESAAAIARDRVAADSSRAIEANQVQVALANARGQLQQSQSNYRLESSQMKQRLRLPEEDALAIDPDLTVVPIEVDVEQAIEYGTNLRPQLRSLDIQARRNEISVQEARGNNAFRLNLELTYGREMQDPVLRELMNDPSNSYTVGVSGYVPIWDWGARGARVQAQRLNLERTRLSIEETQESIRRDIGNVVRNLEEYQQRALNMQDNLELARQVSAMSVAQYAEGRGTMLDLVQAFERQADTAENFLDSYLGYRQAVLDLQQITYYDFENDIPLLERFQLQDSSS